MKAITVEPHQPGTARPQEIQDTDPRSGSVLVEAIAEFSIKVEPSLELLGVLVEPTTVVTRAMEHFVQQKQRTK